MNDRKLLLALALIMAITVIPNVWMKRAALQKAPLTAMTPDSATATAPVGAAAVGAAAVVPPPSPGSADTVAPVREDTVTVRSGLYSYGVSTRGARIVSSRFARYRSLALADGANPSAPMELLPPGDGLLAGTLIAGNDTIRFDQVNFIPSADSITLGNQPASLTLHGQSGAYGIDLTYVFTPLDYGISATGHITGLGPAGGLLLVGLGNGFRNTEADPADNARQSGIVTKLDKTNLTLFGKLPPRVMTTMSGPFDWIAVKSKYFVAGLFAYDSTSQGVKGHIAGLQAFPADTNAHPLRAQVAASLPVSADGAFQWRLYLGPMEYDRLHRMGRDFDDVNPYGWSWLRPVIRPIAVVIRSIFVWMHESLGLGYGLVIVVFGLSVRILLWPLSRIAMRSMARMQAVQPQIAALQERHKDNPQLLQQETFKLYKEHKVNPFGGCWPMLLPYPLLVAVFFVLAYTIEVRGVHFLWMTDLARADPLYVIPVLMAASMFAVSKIGQMGLPPNPQTKMMTWLMPVMMLFFFARFAAGLNLYYTIQNLASIPQQWLVVKERMKSTPTAVVGTVKKK